jgi:hypothetical protein
MTFTGLLTALTLVWMRCRIELLGTGKLYEKSYGLPPVAGGGVEVPQRPGFSIEALSLLAPVNGVKKRSPQNTGVLSRNRWNRRGIFLGRWIVAALRLLGLGVPLRPKEPVKFCFSPHFTLLISGS